MNNTLLNAIVNREKAVKNYADKQKVKRKRAKLERRISEVPLWRLNQLTGDDYTLMLLFREGKSLNEIAKVLGMKDKRFVAARKTEITRNWK